MKVLALDLARNSGFAVVDIAGIHDIGSWRLDAGIKSSGKHADPLDVQHVLMCRRLRDEIAVVCREQDIDIVAVEREFGRGVGQRLLVSLYTAAQEGAFVAGLPCLAVRLGDWRRHIHGSAGRTKDFYKSEAMRLVPTAEDADAAEAALIAQYVVETVRVDGRRAA